jgi:hypothetical protein
VTEDQQRANGWRERRREAQRLRAERTGDSPERRAEARRQSRDGTVKDAADRASVGLVANGAAFNG